MAASSGKRALQLSSYLGKTLLTRSTTTTTKKSSPFVSKTAYRFCELSPSSLPKPTFSRLPVELVGAMSMVPFHSVTATALLNSLLSVHKENWGCLSEGFATPL